MKQLTLFPEVDDRRDPYDLFAMEDGPIAYVPIPHPQDKEWSSDQMRAEEKEGYDRGLSEGRIYNSRLGTAQAVPKNPYKKSDYVRHDYWQAGWEEAAGEWFRWAPEPQPGAEWRPPMGFEKCFPAA